MNSEQLLSLILDYINESTKIENIEVIDISKKTSIADKLIIGSGNSDKQIESAMDNLRTFLKEKGLNPKPVVGKASSWLLLDLYSILVNFFTEETRKHYNLEKLWTEEIK